MNLYCIKNWQGHFETNETRKLKALNWWPKPNKHDGLGFRRMVAERDKIQLFCAWNLICDLASKTTPQGRRGFLERDSKPLNAEDMAFMTGFPSDIFTRALGFFSNPSIGWLCVESAGTPGESAGVPGESAAEGKGREGKEGNGMEENLLGVLETWIPTPEMIRIGKLLKRRSTTVWSKKELKAYKEVPKPVDEETFKRLEAYYFDNWPKGADYRFRDLETLLNNWSKAIDRANNHKASRPF